MSDKDKRKDIEISGFKVLKEGQFTELEDVMKAFLFLKCLKRDKEALDAVRILNYKFFDVNGNEIIFEN